VNFTQLVSEEMDRLHDGPIQKFHPQGPDYFYLTGSDFESDQSVRVLKDPPKFLVQQPDIPNVEVEAVFALDAKARLPIKTNFFHRARGVHDDNDVNPGSSENQELMQYAINGVKEMLKKYAGVPIFHPHSQSQFNLLATEGTDAREITKLRVMDLATKAGGNEKWLRQNVIKHRKGDELTVSGLKGSRRMEQVLRWLAGYLRTPEAKTNEAHLSRVGFAQTLTQWGRENDQQPGDEKLDVRMVGDLIDSSIFFTLNGVPTRGVQENLPKIVVVDDNILSFSTVRSISKMLFDAFKPQKIVWCVGVAAEKIQKGR